MPTDEPNRNTDTSYHAGQVDARLKNLEDGQAAQWIKLSAIGADVTEIKLSLAAQAGERKGQASERKARSKMGDLVMNLVTAALSAVGTWFATRS